MRHVIDFLIQLILAITGAVGFAVLVVGGTGLACGCGLWGANWCRRRWRSGRSKGMDEPPRGE